MIYDAGALIAAERSNKTVWRLHEKTIDQERYRPIVPVGVLGQVWRGGRQANLSRFLTGCRILELDETQARWAGKALAASGTSDVIDATVVLAAAARRGPIITSDPDDLAVIAGAIGFNVEIVRI